MSKIISTSRRIIGSLEITNAMLAGSIAYSKLSLTGAILNADLAGSIAYSKIALTGAILNADLAGSIAYSKLVLTGAILNADLAGSIADAKISSAATWNAKEAALTFSTGLTRAVNTITNNLVTGLAGGQTIIGGTAANEDLTIEGTSHATKTTSYVNLQPTGGFVGIGTTTPDANLQVKGSAYPVFRTTRTSALTSTLVAAGTYQAICATDMVNGFGIANVFEIQDNAAVSNPIGSTGFIRDGADNSGAYIVNTYITGTQTERFRIAANGNISNTGANGTALIHIKAGTATANTAPIKLTAGTRLTTPEAGTIEYETGKFILQSDALEVGGTSYAGRPLVVSKNQDASTIVNISNTSTAGNATVGISLSTDQGTDVGQLFKYGSGNVGYKTILVNDLGFYNATSGHISLLNNFASGHIKLTAGGSSTVHFMVASTGNIAIGPQTPTSYLHLKAGTASASTAPFKLTSGTNLTTAEAGAMEYNGTNLFFTRAGTTRESVITANAVNSVSPLVPNRTITVVIDGVTYYIHAKTSND